uniref:Uncharacterized protein n=1 Tax=Ananas comosus var. bracteatus TaxID=296719 RepID=A0A6V7P4I1_ANACO|nr:unnamed protein product [Ananas comosus var. bracteatus]
MAFVSSDVIDAYQHLLEEAEGQRCIYSTTFLYQTIGTAIGIEIFLNDLTKGVISDAKYWFIPLFDFDHLHLLAVDLQEEKYLHFSSIKNAKYNARLEKAVMQHSLMQCNFVGNFLQNNLLDLFCRRETRSVNWEKINMEDIPMQDHEA